VGRTYRFGAGLDAGDAVAAGWSRRLRIEARKARMRATISAADSATT
jgi:hypothetical protein